MMTHLNRLCLWKIGKCCNDYIGNAHTHPEINFRANSSSQLKLTETIDKLSFSVLLRGLSL
ncbi:hypothetical protein SAMD00079811_52960 [Scytonema sp. HK-05]|nr:hypothetical protein SAMD00079811_52960 [Scytonema sp. HK-05]